MLSGVPLRTTSLPLEMPRRACQLARCCNDCNLFVSSPESEDHREAVALLVRDQFGVLVLDVLLG
jgi:hypothetical protein